MNELSLITKEEQAENSRIFQCCRLRAITQLAATNGTTQE